MSDITLLLNEACVKYTGHPLPEIDGEGDYWKKKVTVIKKLDGTTETKRGWCFNQKFYNLAIRPSYCGFNFDKQVKRRLICSELQEVFTNKSVISNELAHIIFYLRQRTSHGLSRPIFERIKDLRKNPPPVAKRFIDVVESWHPSEIGTRLSFLKKPRTTYHNDTLWHWDGDLCFDTFQRNFKMEDLQKTIQYNNQVFGYLFWKCGVDCDDRLVSDLYQLKREEDRPHVIQYFKPVERRKISSHKYDENHFGSMTRLSDEDFTNAGDLKKKKSHQISYFIANERKNRMGCNITKGRWCAFYGDVGRINRKYWDEWNQSSKLTDAELRRIYAGLKITKPIPRP